MKTDNTNYLCSLSFCTADSYRLREAAAFFKKKGYESRLYRDVLYLSSQKKSGDIYIFNYGCFVMWDCRKGAENKLLAQLKEFSIHPTSNIECDKFFYHYTDTTKINPDEKLRIDIITLESDDPLIKLAISYGLSQSIKLESLEETIKETIEENDKLPEDIATQGHISLSRRAIFKRMGEIFIVRKSINLNIEFLDAPEFFWRNPHLEPFYTIAKNFLDIPGRVSALNQKLDVLQELLLMLNGQIQHRHSSLLESIIILLIAFEIIISLFQLHLV